MLDEANIVEQLQEGNARAFRAVVDGYSPRVYRLALGIVKDPAEAEDVLQETFLSVFRSIGSFRGDSGLGTWIYRIATNASLMRLRRRRDNVLNMEEAAGDGERLIPARPVPTWRFDPEEALLNDEIRRVMDEAAQELSDGLRIVFLLRDVEGLSTAEVGEMLGLSEAAVKSRLHRARLLLRDRLSEYFTPAGEKA